MLDLLVDLFSDWLKLCVRVWLLFSELNFTYLLLEKLIWANKSFLYIFTPFCAFVNYSQSWWRHVAQKHCCCEERTNHDHQWKVYLRCRTLSTSSGCLKSGALLLVRRVWDTFSVNIRDTCLIVVSYFLFVLFFFFCLSFFCQRHPHGTCQFPSSVTPVCCHYVKPSFKFLIKVVVRLQHMKPKLTEKRRKNTSCRYFFAVNVLHLVFSCHCVL